MKIQYAVSVKTENDEQEEFNFPLPSPRPLIACIPARINEYEEEVARFFHWKTGLDYYQVIDHVIDFVISSGLKKIADLLTDTAVFALRLAERKAFTGRVYSFESNITLLERAKQMAEQMKLQKTIEFKHVFHETRLLLPDYSAEAAVSIFDLHRHTLRQYLAEILRILEPKGLFIIAVLTEPKAPISIKLWRWAHLKYIKKNPTEADTVYPDREELIKSLLCAGFRQVIVQEMTERTTMRPGVFSLITATK